MQGHRSVVGSSTETIDFDCGAGSSNAGISPEMFSFDQPLLDILPSSGGSGMLHYGSTSVRGHNLSLWSQGEGSSSSMQNAGDYSEQKFENRLKSRSMGSDMVTGFEDWFNSPICLSQDNIIPSIGSSHAVNRPLTLRGSSSDEIHQNQLTSRADVTPHILNLNVRPSGQSNDPVESHSSLKTKFSLSGKKPISSATHSVGIPGNYSHLMGDNARILDSSYGSCQLPLKRKFIDEDIGQSSTSASARSYQRAEGSSWLPIPVDTLDNDSNIEASHAHLQPVYKISHSSIVSQSTTDVSQVESGRSTRNLRLRLSSSVQHSVHVHIGSPGSAFTPSTDSRRQHPVATFPTSLSFAQEVANQQPHPTSVNVALPRRRSRGSSSRSNSSGIVISEPNDVPNAESTLRLSRRMLERRMRAHQSISRNRRLSVSRGGVGSSVSPLIIQPEPNLSLLEAVVLNSEPNHSYNLPAGHTWGPGHSFTSGQRIAEVTRRSVIAPGGSNHAGLSNNQSLPIAGGISSRQSVSSSSQGNQLAHRRLALLMQRRGNDLPGSAYSLQSLGAAGDDRSRLLSEIWSTLDSMRRGEPLRPEDMMILDQSELFGMAAEWHDRHRDMRLDVDNMSYEELLALEERIGNVNTGLTEEAVMKSLKQHTCTPAMVASSEEETEPCCICQEQYTGGEELGILDCGHNFHTACVKQWLMVKNLCPICKTTGLASQ